MCFENIRFKIIVWHFIWWCTFVKKIWLNCVFSERENCVHSNKYKSKCCQRHVRLYISIFLLYVMWYIGEMLIANNIFDNFAFANMQLMMHWYIRRHMGNKSCTEYSISCDGELIFVLWVVLIEVPLRTIQQVEYSHRYFEDAKRLNYAFLLTYRWI